jgi:uncharacterized membrane protein
MVAQDGRGRLETVAAVAHEPSSSARRDGAVRLVPVANGAVALEDVMTRILLPLALLASGLGAGGLAIAALGGAPLLLALPVRSYVPVHMFLAKRFDPFMPACLILTVICDGVLAFLPGSPIRQVLGAGGAVAALATVAVSVTKNVPINRWVTELDPERLPDNWDQVDPRRRWRNWNLVRTWTACLALAFNVVAVGVLL